MKRGRSSRWILVSLWIATLVGALAVWGLIRYQTEAAHRLMTDLEVVQRRIVAEQWSEALVDITEARTLWERTRRRWALHTDHGEMDIITDAIVDAQAKIFLEDTGAYASISQAIDRIKTVPERDHLVLENIL